MGKLLVLGVGNTLLSDDGVGVHVINALASRHEHTSLGLDLVFRDGGTMGLALLPEIEQARALIIVDATEIGAAPGEVRSFEGADMDSQLKGTKRTAHEVAVADLIAAARLTGRKPGRCALVAVQPGSTDWGLAPTAAVNSAIPRACAAVLSLIEGWEP